ncbi:MAG: HD domain-containing protein [Lachnospiraceae bacterium]|nr:HD domain-containing protein [Lachnospiraceae bacterium]
MIYDGPKLMLLFSIILIMISVAFFIYSVSARSKEASGIKIMEMIIGAIESDDPNLNGHSLYVRRIALLLYDNLPVNYKLEIKRRDLEFAALLIDVGRLGVPRDIIDNHGKLNREEKSVISRHPEVAVKILSPVKPFEKIATWIKYQHERVDGKGKYKLAGDNIPIQSRILAVADTFSAITMSRTYRVPYNYDEALAELRMAAGHQLDEEIVGYFCNIPIKDIENALEEVKDQMKYFYDAKITIDNRGE